MGNDLGSLSAEFEGAKAGSLAIGWDSRGGRSYGTYQIATKVGTMRRFLEFCRIHHPDVYKELNPLAASAWERNGAFAKKWVELAKAGRTIEAERHFIKVTHFDAAFLGLPQPLKDAMRSFALQQVLWSCAVQHGPGGAVKVFRKAVRACPEADRIINAVYDARRGMLGKLTAQERNSVLARYRVERKRALAMAARESA